MTAPEPFHWCCRDGAKRLDKHWLLWGRPRSRFPMQGMVGPDWRVGMWTFLSIPAGTAGWACLIIFGAPDDGGGDIRRVIVIIGAVVAAITMAMYLCTACTDPGIVFKHLAPPPTETLPRPDTNGSRSATMAPTGAGTPVPGHGSMQEFSLAQSAAATSSTAGTGVAKPVASVGQGQGGGGVERLTGEDLEAQQMLAILTEDYRRGNGQDPSLSAPTTAAGLPPDQCIAAAETGSSAVTDMRNAPPPDSPVRASASPPAHTQPGATMCGRCEILRPAGAFHCNLCGVCVEKLDHHCPFMGQCVGRKTLVPFYIFVVAVWSLMIYVAVAVAYLVVAVLVSGL